MERKQQLHTVWRVARVQVKGPEGRGPRGTPLYPGHWRQKVGMERGKKVVMCGSGLGELEE